MTTQELYELTRGNEWRPWWPKELRYFSVCREFVLCACSVPTDEAEALLLGSAVKWLVENNYYHIFLRKYAADKYEASMTISGMTHERKSLLAALLAACKAVEEGR